MAIHPSHSTATPALIYSALKPGGSDPSEKSTAEAAVRSASPPSLEAQPIGAFGSSAPLSIGGRFTNHFLPRPGGPFLV